MISDRTWRHGSGLRVPFESIIDSARQHQKTGGRIYVSTDSFPGSTECVFATVICLYNESLRKGGKYFYQRHTVDPKSIPNLRERMLLEAQKSIDLSMTLFDCGVSDLEVHLDISPKGTPHATSRYADMLSGYTTGVGLDCRVKPDAWAASVADRHSKAVYAQDNDSS
jgi:predicted RNase H-related nuclease YkuK (DUF458 family)